MNESASARKIRIENMKLITKQGSRKWFSISGETLPLKERPGGEKRPRVKSAADAMALAKKITSG